MLEGIPLDTSHRTIHAHENKRSGGSFARWSVQGGRTKVEIDASIAAFNKVVYYSFDIIFIDLRTELTSDPLIGFVS